MSGPVSNRNRSRAAERPARADTQPALAARSTLAIGAIDFPEELPVSLRRDEIADAIRKHQVVIVSGETGSGKTTQLPKICLALGRGRGAGGMGLIGHTQPRRIAATATARRIAEELHSPLGEHVGFKIRFHDRLSPGASVKLMTDGILLAETQSDPMLSAYDTIIIDEAHERSLNIDFLLGYLKRLLPLRPDLKLIVTSATIDAEHFARHFGTGGHPAPVIEVTGRLYPVEVRYRPLLDDAVLAAPNKRDDANKRDPSSTASSTDERGIVDAIVDAVDELARVGPGDVLVFLPGEREIREAAAVLRGHHPPHTEILPLFARLSAEEQERVFKPSNARRIVLATNVAETSLTVPGIRYVVDTGRARVKRYSYRNKVEQLRTEAISRAAANQRAGRCGRVAAGVCIRLYDEADFDARPAFTEPEILRSSLAGVILRMKTLGLGEIEAFPFIEPPLPRAITDGYQLLTELGALDESQALTTIGRELGNLPLDPRIARMIVAAREHDCMTEMLVLASALSIQDPRDRPLEARDAADEAHRIFIEERSDFLSDLKLWDWYVTLAGGSTEHKKSQRQLRDLCRARFISPMRMREWRDVHHQLATTVAEHQWRLNAAPATYEQIHKALLAGLLGNIGTKTDDDPQYLGARGIRFTIWPGSALAKKSSTGSGKPRWVMAAELVETRRLHARKVARIEPEWIELMGAHLLKTSHGDPHWEKKPAAVIVFERGTVYGLPIYGQRRVDYSRLNATHARDIFLREGLVEAMLHRDSSQTSPFEARDVATVRMLAHDRKQIAAVEDLEHKTRRPDVLVDAELLVAFCDARVPADVASGHAFETWYREAAKSEPRLLYLDRDELMRHEAADAKSDAFPKTITMGGISFALDYRFDPGSPRDGVTMTVPLYALNVVDADRCEWLVPGMLKDKAQVLLKSLPQKLRRHCVPLPGYAQGFTERNDPEGASASSLTVSLTTALIRDLREERGIVAQASDFKDEAVPAHLTMNFRIVDEHGRQLAMGRNLAALRAELGQQARRQFKEAFSRVGAVASASPVGQEAKVESVKAHRQVVDASAAASLAIAVEDRLTDWTFGALPELMGVKRGGQTLIGYPALVDRQTHAALEVFDDPQEAARAQRLGVARLFRLQLAEQLRYLEKNLPEMTKMAMQFMALGTADELCEQIVAAAIERACLGYPLPVDAESFATRKQDAKSRIVLLANETARTVAAILDQCQAVTKKLSLLKAHPAALADIEAQLAALLNKRFVTTTLVEQLSHLPRYLKAIGLRIDKLAGDPQRDAARMAEMAPLLKAWQRAHAARKGAQDSALDGFRWLLEELRVALFAQELRTPMPISVKRLQKIWDSQQR